MSPELKSKATAVAASFESLLAEHHVPIGEIVQSDSISTVSVGVRFCEYSLAFDVTFPKSMGSALLARVQTAFSGYAVDVSDWSHLGAPGGDYYHLTARVLN